MKRISILIISSAALLCILFATYVFLVIQTNNRSNINPNNTSQRTSPTTYTSLRPNDPLNPDGSASIIDSPADMNFMEDYASSEATQRPDITITNNVPYENDLFVATTDFVQANPGYFKIIVYMKQNNRQKVEDGLVRWITSLGIPSSSLQKLVIEYREWNDPDMM